MPAIIAHLANAVRGAIIHPTMQRLVMMAPAGVGTIVRSGCWQVPSPNANAVKRTFSSTPVALGARWTAENDEFLRNNMNMPLEELQSHFPNRTVTAIKARQRLIKSQMRDPESSETRNSEVVPYFPSFDLDAHWREGEDCKTAKLEAEFEKWFFFQLAAAEERASAGKEAGREARSQDDIELHAVFDQMHLFIPAEKRASAQKAGREASNEESASPSTSKTDASSAQANDPVDGSLSQTKGDAQDVINPNNFCPREDQDNSEAEAQNPSPRPTMNDRAENTVGDAASAGVGEGREGIESMGDHKGAK